MYIVLDIGYFEQAAHLPPFLQGKTAIPVSEEVHFGFYVRHKCVPPLVAMDLAQ